MAFGSLFTDLQVVRLNKDGTENHRITVPVMFSPREKFIRRLEEDYSSKKQSALTLPRIAFELLSLNYDPQRKLQKMRKFTTDPASGDMSKSMVFMPVPYDLLYSVNVVTKTQDEMLQIIEQIMPGFTPDMNITIKGLTGPDTEWDVPISMMDVQPSDSYDGAMGERRQILWTMTFMLKGYFFGPTGTNSIILTPDVKKFDWDGNNMEGID